MKKLFSMFSSVFVMFSLAVSSAFANPNQRVKIWSDSISFCVFIETEGQKDKYFSIDVLGDVTNISNNGCLESFWNHNIQTSAHPEDVEFFSRYADEFSAQKTYTFIGNGQDISVDDTSDSANIVKYLFKSHANGNFS